MIKTRTLHARFDGEVLKPEEPVDLKQDVSYLITVESEESVSEQRVRDVLDEISGKNELCVCFTAYVDILGYSKLINDCKGDYGRLNNTLQTLKYTLCPHQSRFTKYVPLGGSKVMVFSDCIFINVPINSTSPTRISDGRLEILSTIEHIADYQFNLAINGLFIRGCATVDYSYFSDSIAFGPGLLDVVDCEKKAKCPKICLTNNAMGIIRRICGKWVHTIERFSDYIYSDKSGNYFINYLHIVIDWIDNECSAIPDEYKLYPLHKNCSWIIDNYMLEHKNKIESNLQKYKDSEVKTKYIWLAEYHNFFCKEYFSDLNDLIINGYDENWNRFTRMEKH